MVNFVYKMMNFVLKNDELCINVPTASRFCPMTARARGTLRKCCKFYIKMKIRATENEVSSRFYETMKILTIENEVASLENEGCSLEK